MTSAAKSQLNPTIDTTSTCTTHCQFITLCAVAQHCCKGDERFNGKCHFSGSSSSGTPEPIFKIFCTVDYVRDPTPQAKIWISRPKGACLRMREIVIVRRLFFTARCTLVQSAVLRSHVVCLSVCLSVRNVEVL